MIKSIKILLRALAVILIGFVCGATGLIIGASIGAGVGVGYEAGGQIGFILGALISLIASGARLFGKRTEKRPSTSSEASNG